MDPESNVPHERLCENDNPAGRKWFHSFIHTPAWISYGLLAVLYVLILTLFITVFTGAILPSKPLISSKEMNDFRIKVHNLSSSMDNLHVSLKKKTCEKGWKQLDDSCYFFTGFKASWSKIRNACLKKGADLAVITSSQEQIFLTSYSGSSHSKRFWIGLHDMDEEGNWMWVDGTNYKQSYRRWDEGEPNDYDNEDCAVMWSFGKWNDLPCDHDNAYGICEKKI